MARIDSEPGAALDLHALVTRELGQRATSLHQVDSTNDELLEWAARGAPHGAICVAREQRRGKGRQTRRWHSPPDEGLYLSVLLRPPLDPVAMTPFSLVTALVAAETLEALVGIGVGLKWPNDLLLEGRKVGGILLESRMRPDPVVVIGMGLNLTAPAGGWTVELQDRAVSVEEATGERLDRGRVLCALLNALEPAYDLFLARGAAPFVTAWSARSVLRGCRIHVHEGQRRFSARAGDIDVRGRLEVHPDEGPSKWLQAGEVHLVKTGPS